MNLLPALQPLVGIRILSLALNLPGPAALTRCKSMGATCLKLEPPRTLTDSSADPMLSYSPQGYRTLHEGIDTLHANLKTVEGQQQLHHLLADTDVLITSFRPSALSKLGLTWEELHAQYPRLCMVRIFGDTTPEHVDHPGHDLTFQAEAGLTQQTFMPTSLFADMSGSLMASEAVLQTLLMRSLHNQGHCLDIGLAQAAQWLALPRQWGMTSPHTDIGGAHAGYRMYSCADGHVALAALEPHFAQRLCRVIGITDADGSAQSMRSPQLHSTIAHFFASRSCNDLFAIAKQFDIPLHVIPAGYK